MQLALRSKIYIIPCSLKLATSLWYVITLDSVDFFCIESQTISQHYGESWFDLVEAAFPSGNQDGQILISVFLI